MKSRGRSRRPQRPPGAAAELRSRRCRAPPALRARGRDRVRPRRRQGDCGRALPGAGEEPWARRRKGAEEKPACAPPRPLAQSVPLRLRLRRSPPSCAHHRSPPSCERHRLVAPAAAHRASACGRGRKGGLGGRGSIDG